MTVALPAVRGRGGRFMLKTWALCADPAGVDRQAVHDQLNQDAAAFFRARLPGPTAGH